MYEYETLKCVNVILSSRRGKGTIMAGIKQLGYIVRIYRNVTTKSPVQLFYTNKNVLKKGKEKEK
jgi:hypothetical protein